MNEREALVDLFVAALRWRISLVGVPVSPADELKDSCSKKAPRKDFRIGRDVVSHGHMEQRRIAVHDVLRLIVEVRDDLPELQKHLLERE